MSTGEWFVKYFEWLTSNTPYFWQSQAFEGFIKNSIPSALSLSTGAGKTSLIPIWLLALLHQAESGTITLPRRLIWVINRRAVVDQATVIAEQVAKKFAEPSPLHDVLDSISLSGGIGVSTLRGEREDNQEWSEDPSKPSIVIGTVDMTGSRLLFSGYGLSTRQRAQDAALLCNDALIMNDEAQLSPAFARLIRWVEKMRNASTNGTPFRTVHISATLDESSTTNGVFHFDMDSEPSGHFQKVYAAKKYLRLQIVAGRNDRNQKMAELAVSSEVKRTITMVDTPRDAMEVARTIRKLAKSDAVITMTGTMRGYERDQLVKNPLFSYFTSPDTNPSERFWLVCTSAGESGVDMSSDLMITNFVEADRLIQRFGRLNRFAETTGEAVCMYMADETVSGRGAETLAYLKSLPTTNDGFDISCRTLSKNPPPPESYSRRPGFAKLHERDLQLLSYTSIRHSKLKPDVDAILHGEEGDPPRTEIAWRAETEYLLRASREDLEEWLNVVRVRSHEKLSEHTHIVRELVSKHAGALIVRESSGDITPYSEVEDLRNALIVLPPGICGLSSGMLAAENDDTPFDVFDSEGVRFLRKGDRFLRIGSEESRTADQFEEHLKQGKLFVRLAIPAGEDTELIYVEKKQKRKAGETVYLSDHLKAVEQNVRALAGKLNLPASLTEVLSRAALLHDAGKTHPNWQKAFGNSDGCQPIAKLMKGKRVIKQNILGGLRHEFVSLFEAVNEDVLTSQVVAAHHKWGRPHFPERGYDRRRSTAENRQQNLTNMKRFVALQKSLGVWGLAYIEAILRAADAQAER